jgi:hypothetical protein
VALVDVLEVEELPTETTLPLALELLPVTVVTLLEDEDVDELPDEPPTTVTSDCPQAGAPRKAIPSTTSAAIFGRKNPRPA